MLHLLDPRTYDLADLEGFKRQVRSRQEIAEVVRSLQDTADTFFLEDALERIEDGSFGTCEQCEAKIPKGRLKVMPFSTTCVACKSKQEKQRKMYEGASDYALARDLGSDMVKEDED